MIKYRSPASIYQPRAELPIGVRFHIEIIGEGPVDFGQLIGVFQRSPEEQPSNFHSIDLIKSVKTDDSDMCIGNPHRVSDGSLRCLRSSQRLPTVAFFIKRIVEPSNERRCFCVGSFKPELVSREQSSAAN